MSANEKSVETWLFVDSPPRLARKSFHILAIFNNRHPLMVFVCYDSVKTFQHFIAFNKKATTALVVIRKDRAPYGMRVKHGARLKCFNDREMKQCFCRRFALASGGQNSTVTIDFENLIRCQPSFVHRTRRNRKTK